MTRLNLNEAGDHWVELREPNEITEAGRRTFRIYVAATRDRLSSQMERAEAMINSDDAMIAMFVREWSFGAIPQTNLALLQQLAPEEYDLLQNACGERMDGVFTDFSATKEDIAGDAPLDTPFLADGAAAVGAGGDPVRRDPADAGGTADLSDRETDPLVSR